MSWSWGVPPPSPSWYEHILPTLNTSHTGSSVEFDGTQQMLGRKSSENLTFFFAILFLASPGEHRDQRSDRFADAHKITLHSLRSFRSWLATLCRQIEAPDRETNELLHWMNKTMVRCYAKNFSAVATVRRRRIVAVLNSDWRSAGPGQRLRAPPLWDTIAVDGNWNRTARF